MEKADRATFGDLLGRYRRAAGLSQEDLAELAGVSARGVSDLERGLRRRPHPETVRLLARALPLSEADRAALLAAARPHSATPPRPATAAAPSTTGSPSAPGTFDAPRHNLPAALTSFVGREREVTEVC